MRKQFTYNGKRYSVERKDPKQLDLAVAEKIAQLQENSAKETNKTFKEYSKIWLETFKKPYVAKTTVSMYNQRINNINTYIGHRPIREVTSTEIQYIITSEYNKGFSKSYMDKTIMTLRQIFRQAETDRLIKYNPTNAIRRPQMEETPRRALTDEEYKQILECAEHSKYGWWIKFMLLLGLRPSETARVKGEHFDLKTSMLYIDGTKSKRARRVIPVPNEIGLFLTCFMDKGYIFTTEAGKPLNRQSMRRWWEYFKREWDISAGAKTYRNKIIESKISPDVTMYTLRHTFATRMSSKVPVDVLADIMGHSNVNVAYKYYIHYNEENMQKVKAGMDSLW